MDQLKGKKLLFRWKEIGLLQHIENCSAFEDETIRQQLSTFQKVTNLTIPRSWEAAEKYKNQYEELKKRYDHANEEIFRYQQQQAKVRLLLVCPLARGGTRNLQATAGRSRG